MFVKPTVKSIDFILCFVLSERILLRDFAKLAERLESNGMIWIAWPKKASGIKTDLTENTIRDHALSTKFVDVKVCAIDETWSGLKLVYRLKDRK